MAPQPLNATQLELHDTEVTKPQPLRIIKRSKTISGSSTVGETLYRRSGSAVSIGGEESPPLAADGPLTVYKLRNRRATVLTRDKHDGDKDFVLNFADPNEIQFDTENDSDLTPKAKQQELKSVGPRDFLKVEYYGGNLDLKAKRHTPRAKHNIRTDRTPPVDAGTYISTAGDDIFPNVPPRRVSKSKNFFLRAIGGRSAHSPRPIRRVDSTTSKNTLIRRLSHSRRRSCDSSFYQSSLESPPSSIQPNDSLSSTSLHLPPSLPSTVFVLCPKIIVTSEFPSIDSGPCIMWVAIEVVGVLRRADGQEAHDSGIKGGHQNYGKLHSMHISLHPSQGCAILEVIGNLHQSKTIKEGVTELILAKIRLSQVESTTNAVDMPSAKLIVDLQHHLGDTLSSYLTVRLTYKHPAFPNSKSPTPDSNGMRAHTSRIETEATATIARCHSKSAWLPCKPQSSLQEFNYNALKRLIEKHFSPERARNVINKLAVDKIPISAISSSHHSLVDINSSGCRSVSASQSFRGSIGSAMSSAKSEYGVKISPRYPALAEHDTSLSPGFQVEHELGQIDPARKIWSEMRRTSRGRGHRNTRASISADHYFSFDSPDDERGFNRSSSSHAVALKPHESNVRGAQVAKVDQERNRIMEVALRNQRSVGAETLRSIAPSVSGIVAKPKSGTISSLGLRAWGWGTPWW